MKKMALVLLLMAGGVHADNVTVYDRAPSVEELQRQLTGGGAEALPQKKKVRMRAIVFGDAAQPVQEAQPVAAVPPPAPSQASYQPPFEEGGSVAAAESSPIQVSERAIAFPINFQVNSSEIMPESIAFLESIAGLMRKDPKMRLVVEGHTDASGTPLRNLALSRERAFSVMNFLIDQYRIDPLRLIPVGKGFSEPLGGLEPQNPKNRRVQFRIIG